MVVVMVFWFFFILVVVFSFIILSLFWLRHFLAAFNYQRRLFRIWNSPSVIYARVYFSGVYIDFMEAVACYFILLAKMIEVVKSRVQSLKSMGNQRYGLVSFSRLVYGFYSFFIILLVWRKSVSNWADFRCEHV